MVIVAAGALGGVAYYEGAFHSGGLLSSSSSLHFSVTNVTLSSYPPISDEGGDAGMGALVTIADHNTVDITNATVLVNGVSLGSCPNPATAGQTGVCHVGEDLDCSVYPAAPYNVKVEVVYKGGATESTTQQISSSLTVYC